MRVTQRVAMLARQHLQDAKAEVGQVVRLATRHEVPVDHHRRVGASRTLLAGGDRLNMRVVNLVSFVFSK